MLERIFVTGIAPIDKQFLLTRDVVNDLAVRSNTVLQAIAAFRTRPGLRTTQRKRLNRDTSPGFLCLGMFQAMPHNMLHGYSIFVLNILNILTDTREFVLQTFESCNSPAIPQRAQNIRKTWSSSGFSVETRLPIYIHQQLLLTVALQVCFNCIQSLTPTLKPEQQHEIIFSVLGYWDKTP